MFALRANDLISCIKSHLKESGVSDLEKIRITIQNRLHLQSNIYLSHSLKLQEKALFQPENSKFTRG